MYIEKVADGDLVFFKTMADFVKFHELASLANLPEPPKKSPRGNKNGHVELYVETVRLPPNVTVDDLLPGVAKCYQIMSKNIEVEKLSESSAVIHYNDAYTFKAIFEFLKNLWDQNKDTSVEVPKQEEVTKVFENILK